MLKNDGATEKDSSRRLVDSCLGVEGDALVNPGIVSLSIRVKWDESMLPRKTSSANL